MLATHATTAVERVSNEYDSLDSIAYHVGASTRIMLDLDSDPTYVGWVYLTDLGDRGHDGDVLTVGEVLALVGPGLASDVLADTRDAIDSCRRREADMREEQGLYGATDDEGDWLARITAGTDQFAAELRDAEGR